MLPKGFFFRSQVCGVIVSHDSYRVFLDNSGFCRKTCQKPDSLKYFTSCPFLVDNSGSSGDKIYRWKRATCCVVSWHFRSNNRRKTFFSVVFLRDQNPIQWADNNFLLRCKLPFFFFWGGCKRENVWLFCALSNFEHCCSSFRHHAKRNRAEIETQEIFFLKRLLAMSDPAPDSKQLQPWSQIPLWSSMRLHRAWLNQNFSVIADAYSSLSRQPNGFLLHQQPDRSGAWGYCVPGARLCVFLYWPSWAFSSLSSSLWMAALPYSFSAFLLI